MARGKKKKKENQWRRLKLADPLICFQTQGGGESVFGLSSQLVLRRPVCGFVGVGL